MRWLRRAAGMMLLALAFILAATALSAHDDEHTGLLAYTAWLLPEAEAGDETGNVWLYLTIENTGDETATLTAIETPHLHAEIEIDGDGEALVIEPGAAMQFAPDERAARLVMHDDLPLPEAGVLVRLMFMTDHDDEMVTIDVPALWTDTEPEADDIIAYDGWARPTALEADDNADVSMVIGGAYLTLENRGAEADTLVGVTSPRAGIIELHETQVTNDIARMRPVDQIALGAGAQVRLEPGGLHLMLMDLPEHLLPGDVVPLTLHFASGRELVAGLVVRDAGTEVDLHSHSH